MTAVAVSAALLVSLSGCVPAAPADSTTSGRPTAVSRPTASSTPTAAPSQTATSAPGPTSTSTSAPSPTSTGAPRPPVDAAGAKALAVQACQTIASGFSANNVAQAAPLAAQAAAKDTLWSPLAADLDFIQRNPIDPNTGEGPQKTAEDAAAAAHDCFTLAGVQVSQD